jgi:hypothetical protein
VDTPADFAISISAWCAKAERNTTQVAQNAVIELGSRIVRRTPLQDPPENDIVARGDWNSAVGQEPGDAARNDASGAEALSVLIKTARSWKPHEGKSFFFGNYKPYIRLLEYGGYRAGPRVVNGRSYQAPNGMLGISVVEWDNIVAEEARKINGAT